MRRQPRAEVRLLRPVRTRKQHRGCTNTGKFGHDAVSGLGHNDIDARQQVLEGQPYRFHRRYPCRPPRRRPDQSEFSGGVCNRRRNGRHHPTESEKRHFVLRSSADTLPQFLLATPADAGNWLNNLLAVQTLEICSRHQLQNAAGLAVRSQHLVSQPGAFRTARAQHLMPGQRTEQHGGYSGRGRGGRRDVRHIADHDIALQRAQRIGQCTNFIRQVSMQHTVARHGCRAVDHEGVPHHGAKAGLGGNIMRYEPKPVLQDMKRQA